MLILSRRIGERLTIGENVTVTVLGLKGNQIRLGIDAPRGVPVHREEVMEKVLQAQANASMDQSQAEQV